MIRPKEEYLTRLGQSAEKRSPGCPHCGRLRNARGECPTRCGLERRTAGAHSMGLAADDIVRVASRRGCRKHGRLDCSMCRTQTASRTSTSVSAATGTISRAEHDKRARRMAETRRRDDEDRARRLRRAQDSILNDRVRSMRRERERMRDRDAWEAYRASYRRTHGAGAVPVPPAGMFG